MQTRPTWCMALMTVALVAPVAMAETVTFSSNDTNGNKTPNPPYLEVSGSWSFQNTHSAVSPGKGARTTNTGNIDVGGTCQFSINPTLAQAGGTYTLDISHGDAGTVTTDIIMSITVTGGSLVDADNAPVTSTTAFQRTGANTWERVGTLKLNPGVSSPTITFKNNGTYHSRLFVDAFRCSAEQTCTSGLAILPPPKGPLMQNLLQVTVQGVDASASKISVYRRSNSVNTLCGERTTGIVAGDNVVPVNFLSPGEEVIATQWNAAGVESCLPTVGSVVGYGPNDMLYVCLNIRENPAIPGPIGRDGTGIPGDLFFLGADSLRSGPGTAPSGGWLITPSRCWQTVSLQRDKYAEYNWMNPDNSQIDGNYGVLDGITFATSNGQNTGPYVVYIDNLMNGNVLIQDFENPAQAVMFAPPGSASVTRPFLTPSSGVVAPDIAQVSGENADTGSYAFKASWQFKDLSALDWVLLQAGGPSGTRYPVVDLRQPISFRMLLLPLDVNSEAGPVISDPPHSQSVARGGSADFQVTASDTNPLHYQWLLNGEPVGTFQPSLHLANVHRELDGARVSVSICDDTGSTHSPDAILTVPCPTPFADYDGDSDVDQADFAVFQLCFTGEGVLASPGDCTCFDHDPGGGDGDIDAQDALQFENCATGPAISFTPAVFPACSP